MKLFITFLMVVGLFLSGVADEKKNNADEPAKISTVSVWGTVTDFNTGETLVGVEVELVGTNQKVYTDFDGNFAFENIVPGEYNITANYISYEKQTIENQNIDIFSAEVALQLKSVD